MTVPPAPGSRAAPLDSGEPIQAALNRLWNRTRRLVCERVATIERATAELSNERGDPARIEAGRVEAHKLAGVLGTFGLDHGTELARDLEEHLPGPRAGEESERLAQVAAELRAVVERSAL